jgi:hypothetical protein
MQGEENGPRLATNMDGSAEEAVMVIQSLRVDSRREIDCYKWIESEKVGYDLGEAAVRRWIKDHWHGYLRNRWLDHLQGRTFWIELPRDDFGLLQEKFQQQSHLLDLILARLKACQENLHIFLWAHESDQPIEPILAILEAIDINSKRLAYLFEEMA